MANPQLMFNVCDHQFGRQPCAHVRRRGKHRLDFRAVAKRFFQLQFMQHPVGSVYRLSRAFALRGLLGVVPKIHL